LFMLTFLIVCAGVPQRLAAQDCEEARKSFEAGMALSDNSEREVTYYRGAIDLCPNYFEAYNRLGQVYASWGQFELAVEAFKQAARAPTFAEPHKNLGEIYRMQGRYDLAAEEFTEAVKIDPDFREAENQLKYVQKRLGRYDKVIDAPPEPMPSAIFTTMPGMALPKGALIVNAAYRFMNREADLEGVRIDARRQLGQPSRDVDVHVWLLGIRYGLTNDLTVGLIPKYFKRNSRVAVPFWGIDATPDVTGLGDTVFMTKYRLWGKRRTHLSLFHLLSIPTGDEDAIGEDDGIVRKIPLGSGSYDFQPGIAFTAEWEPFTFTGNVSYLMTGGRSAGDEFHVDLALAFPRWGDFVALMELNYRSVEDSERETLFQTQFGFQPGFPGASGGPITQVGTLYEEGGQALFLSPGVQFFFTNDLKGELGVQVPIMKPEHGWVEELVIHVGVTKYFF
jgi:hypothetical protein